jgi:hypothetical protein
VSAGTSEANNKTGAAINGSAASGQSAALRVALMQFAVLGANTYWRTNYPANVPCQAVALDIALRSTLQDGQVVGACKTYK